MPPGCCAALAVRSAERPPPAGTVSGVSGPQLMVVGSKMRQRSVQLSPPMLVCRRPDEPGAFRLVAREGRLAVTAAAASSSRVADQPVCIDRAAAFAAPSTSVRVRIVWSAAIVLTPAAVPAQTLPSAANDSVSTSLLARPKEVSSVVHSPFAERVLTPRAVATHGMPSCVSFTHRTSSEPRPLRAFTISRASP